MDVFNSDLSYELQLKGLEVKEGVKKQASQIVRDIKRWVGGHVDVKVTIEPEATRKRLFSVAVAVDGVEEPVTIKKRGKNIVSILKKVKRIALRKLTQKQSKRVRGRRFKEFGRPLAS